MSVLTRTLSASQRALVQSLSDIECVQYLTPEGLEVHDVDASALLGSIASITYPYDEVDALVHAGLIRLIDQDEDPFSDRPYYVLSDEGERLHLQ